MYSSELKNRILFTVFILLIYRLGTFIPIPGVNSSIIGNFFDSDSANVFSMINLFSGGALERMSIFALNIMPYITASIIMQLVTSMHSGLSSLKKEGEYGRAMINQYTRYFTVILAFFQSVGVYYTLHNMNEQVFISDSSIFLWTTCVSLVGGTVVLMWFGEKITNSGVGNGISLIIFVGIISSIPNTFSQIMDLSRSGVYSAITVLIFLFLFVLFVAFIVFVEKSIRKIKIQYPNRTMIKLHGNSSDSSFLPLKINMSGVIPPIFASSILMFPLATSQLFGDDLGFIFSFLRRGGIVYFLIFASLIIFFCFFYSSIVFNTKDLSENLKKNNCFIAGIRPGQRTEEYLDKIILKLTVIGSVYLVFVCIIPEILITKYSIPLYIGGTGILIIVSVIIDLFTQIQSYGFSGKYNNMSKSRRRMKVKMR